MLAAGDGGRFRDRRARLVQRRESLCRGQHLLLLRLPLRAVGIKARVQDPRTMADIAFRRLLIGKEAAGSDRSGQEQGQQIGHLLSHFQNPLKRLSKLLKFVE